MSEVKLDDQSLNEVAGGASSSLKVIGTATVNTTHLNIRYSADKNSERIGETNAPAKYDVYEIAQNQGYIWYRIDIHKWIASDGTWVTFSGK